jgi:hypothetical protein
LYNQKHHYSIMYKTKTPLENFKKVASPGAYYLVAALLLLPALFVVINARKVEAAALTTSYIRLNRLKATQTTSFRLQFRTVGSGATSVAINFNGVDSTTWTGTSGLVNATQTAASATCATETGDTGLPGSLTASGSGSTITISSVTALSATTTYCVDLTSATAVTNAAAGEYHPIVTVGSDTTTLSIRTISDDQVVITATVPPTFNFVITGGNTDTFSANLSTGSVVSTNGKAVTITTNAASGWITWVKSLNGSSGASTKGALKSSSASNYTIPTTNANVLGSVSHTLTPGSEDYGLGVTITTDSAGGGVVALDAAYDGTSTKAGVLDPNNFRAVASANGTTNGDTITLTERATIQGGTPAANDYTDTLTIIGAADF